MKHALVLFLAIPSLAWAQAPAASRSAPANPTWSEHVAPIVFKHCTQCHREGEAAPFRLETYRDAKKRARMIARVTKSRFMPPWHPVEGHGKFLGEQVRLSSTQIETIQNWAANKAPEGDASKTPPMPQFTKGWQLGKPDMIVQMPLGYKVRAGGSDIYRNFVIPLELKGDKWLTAIEVRPSARSVLHHIIFSLDTSGEARRMDGRDGQPGFRGMGRIGRNSLGVSTSGLGGWAVGGQPRHLPLGLARKLPKGADLVLRSHLHPSGKEELEQTTLGLYFTKKPPKRTMVGIQLPPFFGIAAGLNLKPGAKNFQLEDSFVLPCDVEAITVGGHAHYLCTEMQVWATKKNGMRKSIFWINEWDFDWQNRYTYRKPLLLEKGTKIDARVTYDNSSDNPNQQFDPPRFVGWGPQSTDEMGSITLLVVPKRERDAALLQRAVREKMRSGMTGERAINSLRDGLVQRIKALDKNGDGKVTVDELPERWRRFGARLDRDGDGVLSEKELEGLLRFGRRRR